jgi:hypothetical protein
MSYEVLFLVFGFVGGLREPASGGWTLTPKLHAPAESRATETTILFTWTPAIHSIEQVGKYELSCRYPKTVIDADSQYMPKATEDGDYPTSAVTGRDWVTEWSSWYSIYTGLGRQFLFDTSIHMTGIIGRKFFDCRVRATTEATGLISDWSLPVQAHTVIAGDKDRFVLEIVGTGRNNPATSLVRIGSQILYKRSDSKGFILIVLDRRDMSVAYSGVYNVYEDSEASQTMSEKIRSYGPLYWIIVASSYAWEWHTTPTLTDTLLDYGAYYVGQWSRVFSGTDSVQSSSRGVDLAEMASEDSFGHPYAFLGWYGCGMGNCHESIQLNTGHYLATGKAQKAILRLPVYFNYMLGRYMIGVVGAEGGESADLWRRGQIPKPATLHSPYSAVTIGEPPFWRIQSDGLYAPYIGNLWNQLEYLIVANDTGIDRENGVRNYGYEIIQQIGNQPPQVYRDPRRNVQTELERIWGGPSVRYSAFDGLVIPASASVETVRVCGEILNNRWKPGVGCPQYDSIATSQIPMLQFGIGMWPMVCDASRAGRCGSPVPSSFTPFTSKPDPSASVSVVTENWP